MKRFLKISIMSIAIGLVFCFLGWKNNGIQSMTIDKHFVPKIVKYTHKKTDLKSFTAIKGNLSGYYVHIVSGDKPTVRYTGQAQSAPHFKIKDGQLIVTQKNKNYKNMVSAKDVPNELFITVPSSTSLKSLDWTLKNDDLVLKNLHVKKTKLNLTNGYYWAYQSSLGKVMSIAGQVSLHQVRLSNGSTFTQDGAFKMVGGSYQGHIKVHTGYVNQLYGLNKNDGYTLHVGSSDGENIWYGKKAHTDIIKNPQATNQIYLYTKDFTNRVDHQ
ncbi:DUF4097 family beta strand repeat-containing protein [Pediococcus cellicola]|uniref:DUF4097 family beta strand repeat-containing protein n=1 Tax=Pediococcus cellicola TaxID=319652 RepID=UPI00070C8CE1|nr:DUF4097 family beta strand repeat-containing protein [Pediococcus cellicola]GEL15993.1 hypothetical protein PCE01_17950 [Pediococcus cellicola]